MKTAGRFVLVAGCCVVAASAASAFAQYRPGVPQPSFGRPSPYGGGQSYRPGMPNHGGLPYDPRPQVPRPHIPGQSYRGAPYGPTSYGRSPYGPQLPSPIGDMYMRLGSNAVEVKYCTACENIVPYHTSHNGQCCPHCRVHWNTAGAIVPRQSSDIPSKLYSYYTTSGDTSGIFFPWGGNIGPFENPLWNELSITGVVTILGTLFAVFRKTLTGGWIQ